MKGTRLAGKVCIVTGAGSARGIGWATVKKLASEGARHIYVLDIATDELPGLVDSLRGEYLETQITIVRADVSDDDAIRSACDRAVQENGQLDVFFANAGGAKGGFNTFIKDMSADTYLGTMKLNALSCFLAVKYASEAMSKTNPDGGKGASGGSIILTASVAGLSSAQGAVDYSSSKAAIISLARNAAHENLILRNGVRVNALCPGFVRTALSDTFLGTASELSSVNSGAPGAVLRTGVPAELANAVCFLASGKSYYVTGQPIIVDGGLSVFIADNPVALADVCMAYKPDPTSCGMMRTCPPIFRSMAPTEGFFKSGTPPAAIGADYETLFIATSLGCMKLLVTYNRAGTPLGFQCTSQMSSLDPSTPTRGTRLAGKVCIITGAGSAKGIGWATVEKFASEGARHVYILDIATDELPGLVASLSGRYPGTKSTIVKADVSNEDAIRTVCDRAVQENGQLDVFFANVGLTLEIPSVQAQFAQAGGAKGGFNTFIKDMSPNAFMEAMKLNALSCFLAAKYATVAMSKTNPAGGKHTGGGSIVFTASIAGLRAGQGFGEYSASKAAIISLAQNSANENLILRNGVRVNAVCPGMVRTGLVDLFLATPGADAPKETPTAMIRPAVPAEIANVVCFLASGKSSIDVCSLSLANYAKMQTNLATLQGNITLSMAA
ncbi:hypothetical protein NM688_g2266 [Phlebia brevispora]|uniref:Uncharacterized protein n=1 Tax=Phlebia brevispora TaxID=194682 RepID=A0ACC1T8Z5_9APHY|nr:hypothetical protein NM688_g2266 [Phlebia brevispora]